MSLQQQCCTLFLEWNVIKIYDFFTRTEEESYPIYIHHQRREEYSKNGKVGKLFNFSYQIDNSEDISE